MSEAMRDLVVRKAVVRAEVLALVIGEMTRRGEIEPADPRDKKFHLEMAAHALMALESISLGRGGGMPTEGGSGQEKAGFVRSNTITEESPDGLSPPGTAESLGDV